MLFESVLAYVRSWFTPDDLVLPSSSGRKRRGSDNICFKSPKSRRVLSTMSSNVLDDDLFSPIPHETVVIDDENDSRAASRPIDIRTPRRTSENRWSLNGNDDLSVTKSIRSTTEKKLDAKRNNFEYITRFSSVNDPQNGSRAKRLSSPISKNYRSSRPSLRSTFSSPTLDHSVRLEEKKKYQKLLDAVNLQNSFNSSVYGTPIGSFYNRSQRLVDLAKSPKRHLGVIDLTESSKTKLSTKDRLIKVLDDFEESEVIEDSDSDVEILPNPPSPKPDIKVEPINSLKTVIDTSKASHHKWLDDFTKKHEIYVKEKSKEIKSYTENSNSLNEINHELLLKSLTRKVKDCLSIKGTILPVEEEEEEVDLPPLSDDQLRMVKKAFSGDPNEVLTKKFNLHITRKDLLTLNGLNWLNDNVINFYMNLIMERGKDSNWPDTYTTNTFFYQKLSTAGPESLKRWTRRVDIFSYEFICVPIHLGMHWCMAIINLKDKTIKYYDSMGQSNNKCLNALKGYLEFEHMDKKGQPFSTKDFVLENVPDIPQQMNGSDCGMFSCTFAEFATRKARFTFQQEDMPYLRKKMVVEILTGELLIQ